MTSLCIKQMAESEKNEEIDKTNGRGLFSMNEAELSKSITKEKDEYMRLLLKTIFVVCYSYCPAYQKHSCESGWGTIKLPITL